MNRTSVRGWWCAAAALACAGAAWAQGGDLRMTEALLLDNVATAGRTWLRVDHHEAALVYVGPGPYLPAEGDSVTSWQQDIDREWFAARAGDDGWIRNDALRGGYACWSFESDSARVMILEASGHTVAYVNNVPRVGDPYETGYVRLPVLVRHGLNTVHLRGGRGRVRAQLVEAPESGVLVNAADATLGDAPAGERAVWRGAVVVVNASREPLKGLRARVAGDAARAIPVPEIVPLGVRKVMFETEREWGEEGDRELVLEVVRPGPEGGEVVASAPVTIRVLDPHGGKTFKHTFVSGIDGSLQYYAARAATAPGADTGLVLTLHGAGVEATGQADAYAPKPDFHIVAPTNRRPYGFDWEDWGRMDALEVLADAGAKFRHDPRRVYLTGHSMGGHGTWQIGGLLPDRFAAIAPSAGWATFWTYTERARPAPWDEFLPGSLLGMAARAARSSDTLALVDNYLGMGVYILHGDKDDNVPVAQARLMRERLEKAGHAGLAYHEQPGAGHRWGAECVDWPGIFEMFRRETRPAAAEVERVRFVTADLSVSPSCHWVRVEAQGQRLTPTSVDVRVDRAAGRITGTTSNAAVLAFDAGVLGLTGSVEVELDGTKLEGVAPGPGGLVRVVRRGDAWVDASGQRAPRPAPGPFKRAFDNNFVLVYATRGTAEENAWALAKARFDAETWWYRGNGTCDVIADDDFDPLARQNAARNVIVYGNAEINSAYGKVVPEDAPVSLMRGRATVAGRELEEDMLGVMFVCRRADADARQAGPLVAVIGGTGAHGMRGLDRVPMFMSGVGIPDVVVIGADMLMRGADGVRTIGFYGPDGTLGTGPVVQQKGFDMPGE